MAAGVKSAVMKRLFPALLLLAFAAPAFAWSKQGHQLVGSLAESDLTPAARAEVDRLLAGEPDPTLAGVATWADEIRADGNELGERSRTWHYINFQRGGCDYVPARECPGGNCVIGAINAQRVILADPDQPLQARREALKFVVHYVGDAHQPMHAGFRSDRGGNDFQLNYRGKGSPKGEGTNLHGVWDYWLLRSANLDNAAYAARLRQSPLPADPASGSDNPAAEWTLESCRLIAGDSLYPPGRRIGDDYLDRHRPTAERRIRQAGARLAALINDALDPAH